MLSATPSNNSLPNRLLKLAVTILLPLLLLLAMMLLILVYRSTSTMINDSIRYQLQEINDRSQSRLDSYLSGLDNLLSTTVENHELANILLQDDRQAAKQLLQSTLSNSYGEYLDLLILTRQDQYWTNMNSPLYLLEHSLKPLISNTPYYNKWSNIELDPSPTPLIAMIQRYPILSVNSGQITGSLFGGLILNDNLTLLSLLGEEIKNTNLQLVLRGKPIGPVLVNTDVSSQVFSHALSSQEQMGQVHGHYFSLQPLLINGEPSELSLLLLSDKTAFHQLQKNYFYHLLLAVVLLLIALSVVLLYRVKVITRY
ncbi:LuxQ periplasmic sensor domain-containing protein [Oceanisphaera ostreae]|uniref:LuxQ periplasmic sensor domain-containing protein n=1 Tax=Oceanisphaera ostreae TaxID=914151 RepID=A0ABW3KJT1_9GAMM